MPPPVKGKQTPPAAPPPPPPEPEYVPLDDQGQEQPAAPEPEKWAVYTPEELAQAQEELSKMTPEELLYYRNALTALEAQYTMPEMGGVVLIDLQTEKGATVKLTVRGPTITRALIDLVEGVRFAYHNWNWRPVTPNMDFPTSQRTNGQQKAGGQQKASENAGTSPLHKIAIRTDREGNLRTEFTVGKFQYPFGDSRGPEVVAALFDEGLGWTPEHFSSVAEYNEADFGSKLFVDWVREINEKTNKAYYNVKRVHA